VALAGYALGAAASAIFASTTVILVVALLVAVVRFAHGRPMPK
jgi:hypothetical protein